MTDFINNRFDRQNRVYGVEATNKLLNSTVILFGQKSDCMFEIAKNLVLGGIKKIFIVENSNNNSTINQFNLTNYNDNTVTINHDNNSNFLGNIHNVSYQKLVDEISVLNPYSEIKLINYSDIENFQNNNVFVFVNDSSDDKFTINDAIRNNNNKFIVLQLNQQQNNLTIYNDFVNHHIVDVDGENYESFTILEYNYNSSNNTITIKTNGNHELSSGNIVKLNISLSDLSIDSEFKISNIVNTNTFEIKHYDNKHNHQFINGYVTRIKVGMDLNHKCLSEIITNKLNDDNISDINPVIQSFIGAVITSECVKAITNKYIPFDQSYTFDFNSDIFCKPTDDLLKKLYELKYFIVGSGAIGCELLKNLAMIGVKNIHITDPDHIEVSNLSRQFLFRNDNVGSSKSVVASNRIKNYNKNINITSYQEKLSSENQKFVDKLLPNIDIVFNALDNLNARLYVDQQVIKYTKPLFESGTLGTKGNTQPIIPHITESYGASQDQQVEKNFAVCTIKHYPTLIQHTIHYALDDFNGLFCQQPQHLLTFLDNKLDKPFENISELELAFIKSYLHRVIKMLQNINSINDYIEWAYCLWYDRFCNRINKLLTTHPKDSLTEEGTLFWSNGKRCPTIGVIRTYDFYDYMYATTNLLINTYRRNKIDLDVTNLRSIIENYDYNLVDTNMYMDDPENNVEYDDIPSRNYVDFTISPQEFEKDDDTNFHIAYIHSTSNNRAINYEIPVGTFYDTKGIAGKIIPALATTTSIVASLITLEMLKYVINNNRPIEDYQSYFVNLANNLFIPGEPFPPKSNKINNINFTEWDNFEFNVNECTIDNLLQILNDKFKTNISMITSGTTMIYSDFNNSNQKKMIKEIIGNTKTKLSIFSEDDDIELPNVTITY
jgi:molybdopterin/thiamine biosynthesis adenylyltransferase